MSTDLRARHARQTREIILAAYVELLKDGPAEAVPVTAIAKRAEVAAKTIYRHFPTRGDLNAAAGSWIREHLIPMVPMAALGDLPAAFAAALRSLDERPELARALATSDVGREIFTEFEQDLSDSLSRLIREHNPRLSEAQHRRAHAALQYLDSIYAWVTLRDRFGMSAAEQGEVIGWMMRLVIDEIGTGEGDGPEGDDAIPGGA